MDEETRKKKGTLRRKLEEAKRDVAELGGWAAFKSGDRALYINPDFHPDDLARKLASF